MTESTREIEVKLPFPSPDEARDRLVARGAKLRRPRVFEDNLVFDRTDRFLSRNDRLLRLRRSGEEAWLTFKSPVEDGSRHKVRIEHETSVENPDALFAVLCGAGFEVVWRYQKWRTEFVLGRIVATVDETAIGCWVELEGERAEIDAEAAALGFPPDRYVKATYRELFEAWSKERGVTNADLLLERSEPGRGR